MRPTHRFVATYRGHLAGVIIMATPNTFSNLLGKEYRDLEKLISRGACISWSPKNLASALIMFSIRWMVKNTGFRFFTAYSDTEARELGTIYQACNFIYLGQNSGGRFEYFDPENPKRGWFSDRQFRKLSHIKRYVKVAGITWSRDWANGNKIIWETIPPEVASAVKIQARIHQSHCHKRALPPKHKYVYILAANNRETKGLRNLFESLNPKLKSLTYPKIRRPQINTADKILELQEENLTAIEKADRPHGHDGKGASYMTIKETAEFLRVSLWTIYSLVKTDPSFPYLNIGLKKKLVIDRVRLEEWMKVRSKYLTRTERNIPSSNDLLKISGA